MFLKVVIEIISSNLFTLKIEGKRGGINNLNEENKIGYYAVIPATILFNKDLKANEKLLYAIITIFPIKKVIVCFKCLFKQFIRCSTTYNIKMGFSFKRMRFRLFRYDKK